MIIFRNLALDAPLVTEAENLFMLVEIEANYIQENKAWQAEEFYGEYGVLFIAKAMKSLKDMGEATG